jgi:uncharacterized GH25 family protein
MSVRILAVVLTLVISSGAAAAHDLFLVTGLRGAEGKVCARIGEQFPESANGVTADRVALFRLRSKSADRQLEGKEEPKQFCAPLPKANGIAEMVIQPRFMQLAAKDFNEYVSGEGLREVARIRKQNRQTDEEGRELYSRYAKLIVGSDPDSVSMPLGHTLEIIPSKHPAQLKPGENLQVLVLFRGNPLADAQVAAVYAGAELEGHTYPVLTRTDGEGRVLLKIDRPGWWYVRIIHMVQAENDPEVDWRSYFATLTLQVPASEGNQPPSLPGPKP